MSKIKFIGYPEAPIYEHPRKSAKIKKKVLWGDWAMLRNESTPTYQKVSCRGATGWVDKELLQDNRILEVNFIDVGQGDGCFIVTPKDEFILIDAGQEDNMYKFLSWRFNLSRNREHIPIKYLIITHPDSDHYYGFKKIINSKRFSIEKIFHNGIVERTGKNTLGPFTALNDYHYLTNIIDNFQELKSLVLPEENRGGKWYPNLLYKAIKNGRVGSIEMLEKEDRLEGYGANDDMYFNILGPVCKQDADTGNKKWLRYFDKSNSETKNGHSIIIKLEYDKVKILLGGDLNDKSEEYLAEHYTGLNPHQVNKDQRKQMIEKGKEIFQSDVAKSCHHGSHKFIDDFLSFINPVATIISSGDNETHTHPRPDTLGALGKHSRGERPLIFSTELARSAKDKIEINDSDAAKLTELNKKIKNAKGNEKKELLEKKKTLKYKMERNVAVYGMINLRTDGKRIIIAQKKEQKGAGFIIHKLGQDKNGEIVFIKD